MTNEHADRRGSTMAGPGDHWAKEEVVAEFVAQTTARAEERREMFDFACDLFPFAPHARIRVLDLGAGYGAFAAAVLDRFPNATAVGLDMSEPMMAVGRERMARFGDRFSRHVGDLSNGELPADLPGPFDAVITSAFVLHLPREAKQQLYAGVFPILNPGGCFVDIDLIAPASEELRAWYRERGPEGTPRQRRGDQAETAGPPAPMPRDHFGATADHLHHQMHHHLETEADQLALLRAAGFVQVDCFYKRLRQTVIGGYKPSRSWSRHVG